MKREVISSENAPAAVGPYSQGIAIGQFIFTSGQIPIDPETGVPVRGDIKVQTEQVLKNIKYVLEAGGASLDDVVKVTMFINNMDDYDSINEIYSRFFTTNLPARSCVEVSRLPKDVGIEMEAIAAVPQRV